MNHKTSRVVFDLHLIRPGRPAGIAGALRKIAYSSVTPASLSTAPAVLNASSAAGAPA